VSVDPIESTLKAPGSNRLKLISHRLRSNFAFKFNLRRYSPEIVPRPLPEWGQAILSPQACVCVGQGLRLVHIFAQPEPCL